MLTYAASKSTVPDRLFDCALVVGLVIDKDSNQCSVHVLFHYPEQVRLATDHCRNVFTLVCLSVRLSACLYVCCTVCAVCSESLDLKISFLLCDAFVRTNHHAVAIMFVCLSVRLSVRLSVCLFVRLSVWHVHAL